MIKKVNIIGAGNVATHLAKHLSLQLEVCTVFSRNIENSKDLAKAVNSKAIDNLNDLCDDVDLNIISLTDGAIIWAVAAISKNIPIVHTSGSIKIDVFKDFIEYGILYPLQTFSKTSCLDISNIPFILESSSKKFGDEISGFCQEYFSNNWSFADSELRSEIHLAAVISNNFITALLAESEEILKKNKTLFNSS